MTRELSVDKFIGQTAFDLIFDRQGLRDFWHIIKDCFDEGTQLVAQQLFTMKWKFGC